MGGMRHRKGLSDQRKKPTVIWQRGEGFLVDPLGKYALCGNQYASESGDDARRGLALAANMAFVEAICRQRVAATISTTKFNVLGVKRPAAVKCDAGIPELAYYQALEAAYNPKYLPPSLISAAWKKVAPPTGASRKDPFAALLQPEISTSKSGRMLNLWSQKSCQHQGITCQQGPVHDKALASVIRTSKRGSVGGESRSVLETYYGMTHPNMKRMQEANLPANRIRPSEASKIKADPYVVTDTTKKHTVLPGHVGKEEFASKSDVVSSYFQ